MYCQECKTLSGANERRCSVCGSKNVREPVDDDLCFLVEKEAIWGEMLADVLKQNRIRYLRQPMLGAGIALNTGSYMERYRFFVPFSQIREAQNIVDELFNAADE